MSVSQAVEKATTWLKRKQTETCWRIPVISECLNSTAWSLHIIDEPKKRQRIINYLIKRRVWRENLSAASHLIHSLIEEDRGLAKDVLKQFSEECKRQRVSNGDRALKMFLLKDKFPLRGMGLKARVLSKYYSLVLKMSPHYSWSSRTSIFYDQLPLIAPIMITSDKKLGINHRIEEELIRGLNEDASYAGNTGQTIKSAYVFRQLDNESYAKKAIGWLDKVFNRNGSFKPILYQDVYDTAWATLALSKPDEKRASSALRWLESVKVENGYPYYSGGYYPDPDDTSLTLFLKIRMNSLSLKDSLSVDFLLQSQNPDGGWGFLPFFALSPNPYSIFYKHMPSLERFSSISALTMWQRSFKSTIDMTSRVLITLASFREDVRVKKAIAKGARYLLSNFSNGQFHTSLRWTDTDVYETSMALIALFKNGLQNTQTQNAINWLLGQPFNTAEDAAHLLWALIEGGAREKEQEELANLIVSLQIEDGSWNPRVCFFSGQARFYSEVFSTAAPLFVLQLYLEKNKRL